MLSLNSDYSFTDEINTYKIFLLKLFVIAKRSIVGTHNV